jgi:hypothetical protein
MILVFALIYRSFTTFFHQILKISSLNDAYVKNKI